MDNGTSQPPVACEQHQACTYAEGDLVRFTDQTGYNKSAEYRVLEILPSGVLFRRVNNCRCAAYDSCGRLQFPKEDCTVCGYSVEFPWELCAEMGLTHV